MGDRRFIERLRLHALPEHRFDTERKLHALASELGSSGAVVSGDA